MRVDVKASVSEWEKEFYAKLNSKSIPGLDGIRAIAVLLVILYHFGLKRVNGATGVLMFFVLSGFLITWLLIKENEENGNISLSGFYRRRIFRIFPAFYLFWAISNLIYVVRGHHIDVGIATSSLFYVSNYYLGLFPGATDTHLAHTWSLGIEEQFYIFWPIVFYYWGNNLKRLTWIAFIIIMTVWFHRAVLHFYFDVYQGYIYHAFDTRLDHLMIGCLLAILLKSRNYSGIMYKLCKNQYGIIIAAILLGISINLHGIDSDFTYRHTIGWAIEPILVAIIIVQVVYFSA